MSATNGTGGAKFTPIIIDGGFSDWSAAERVDNPADAASGYALFGTVQNNTYMIGIEATSPTSQTIGAGTTIWLNTDQNLATGYNLFGNQTGIDYEVQFNSAGTPYLYSVNSAGATTQVSSAPLTYALSADGKSLELAIPRALLTPPGGTAPTSISFLAQLSNFASATPTTVYLPPVLNQPEYVVTDPATLIPETPTHRVAIIYSDTSAAHYFSPTAYSDLIMSAENQARMAGVSYDLIDESKLTNINNLIGYDALIFPSMADVNTAQLPQIIATLNSAVYNYHISIITAGDFLTNDQNGAPLAGNWYANMEQLIGLARYTGGNSGNISVTAADVSNPIMHNYTAGQQIQTYTGAGYAAYQAVGGTTDDVLVSQNVSGVGTLPGVVETTTGANNVQFASTALIGDSNLLSNAIQSVVLGTQPGVKLDLSRQAGVMAVRMDMDQSQFPSDVTPSDANGNSYPGIYDVLIPIMQQWHQQFDFVGSYYINIGDNPNADSPTTTDWTVNAPYYQALLALGGEIGNHSYTHLINPPTTTFTATTSGVTAAGSTQITLTGVPPSFAGVTVGMIVSGGGLGYNTPLAGTAGEGGASAYTVVTAVSGNTITISYVPGGYGSGNAGAELAIPAGTQLTFSLPAENTNFLQTGTTGTVLSADGAPFTYAYEFNQSKLIEQQQLGTTIYGAAIPGANETLATDLNILPYYQSVAATATSPGYTGYLTGGWTGIGSGYPSAIGYINPADENSLYIAPNMTFDFTEIQYEGKTVAQADADWLAQLQQLTADAAGTPIAILPIHDYGAAAWNTTTSTATGSPYTTAMYTTLLQQAYNENFEFLTLEELAARYVAEQKATINYTTSGNTITATVTPDPTAPDVGGMALSVINGGSQVIQSINGWYAYNSQELFLPKNGGTFVVNLGATQNDVTHIDNLPARADLNSVSGDGTNLNFTITGDGQVTIHLKNPGTNFVSVLGASVGSLSGSELTLTYNDTLAAPNYAPLQHTVSVTESASPIISALNEIVIGTPGNDIVVPVGSGIDTYISNGGTDTLMLNSDATDYQVVTNADGSKTVTDLRNGTPDGTDTLIGNWNIVYGGATIVSIATSGPGITNGNGDLGISKTVTLTVNFNETVFVAGGIPTLTLNDGGMAAYTSGSGSTQLVFTYVVVAGQNTSDLTVSSLNLPTGVTIRNAANVNSDVSNAAGYNPAGILQIDTKAPATPPKPTLAASSKTGTSTTGTDLKMPTLTGTAEAASTVKLYDGTTLIGTAVTAANGTWSATSTVALADGVHNLIVTATDLAGNTSAASTPFALTVDTVAPAAPVFDRANAANNTIGGTAEAQSVVSVYNGSTLVGTATAGAAGNWSLTVGASTTVRVLTATAKDTVGNVSTLSTGAIELGTSGSNTLTSTAGNDLMSGGGGADVFKFLAGFAHDIITDFTVTGANHDVIDFSGKIAGLDTFANVMSHATQVGTNVMITLNANSSVTIDNINRANLTANNFSFA